MKTIAIDGKKYRKLENGESRQEGDKIYWPHRNTWRDFSEKDNRIQERRTDIAWREVKKENNMNTKIINNQNCRAVEENEIILATDIWYFPPCEWSPKGDSRLVSDYEDKKAGGEGTVYKFGMALLYRPIIEEKSKYTVESLRKAGYKAKISHFRKFFVSKRSRKGNQEEYIEVTLPAYMKNNSKFKIKSRGGYTVATLFKGDDILSETISFCSDNDNFCYKAGAQTAIDKMKLTL